MKIFKRALFAFAIVLFVIALLIFRPVPIPDSPDECLVQKGTVTHVFEGGTKDVVFRLRETDQMFYVNRGLENGLELEDLKTKVLNREITLRYPKYWTPLDFNNLTRHVSQVEFEGEVLYSEIR